MFSSLPPPMNSKSATGPSPDARTTKRRSSPVSSFPFKSQRGQREESFFRYRAQPLLHRGIPAPAAGELCDELVEFRQSVDMELRLEAHTPRVGKFEIQDHNHYGQPPGGYAAFEQRSPYRPDTRQ